MKKEIVIATYSEDTSWIKECEGWHEQVTLYSCGNPTRTLESRFVSEDYLKFKGANGNASFMGMGGGFNDSSSPFMELMKLLELIKKMKHVLKDFDSNDDDVFINEQKKAVFAKVPNENNKCSLESHQWLSHIIRRYDTLADVTVFLQGHPQDHYPDYRRVFEEDFDKNFKFTNLPHISNPSNMVRMSHFDDATYQFWDKMHSIKSADKWDRRTAWAVGAEFAASKEVIRSKPKKWYEDVLEIASTHEFSAHALERTWWVVLGGPEITKF